MFGINPTPFDLRLIAFRIPIRVHPSFWIVAAFLGWNPDRLDIVFLWVMCLFVSILVHELGHALVSEALGWPSEIVLYWCGGLALSQRYTQRTPWREIAVALAGPFAGFGLYALVRLVVSLFIESDWIHMEYSRHVIAQLIWINLYWGLVNLLPVLPLDGGHVSQSLLILMRVPNPLRTACMLGALVAGAAAAYFFRAENQFAGMLFAMLCLQNITMLQAPTRSPW
jgi:stage IV sporulation protein FB